MKTQTDSVKDLDRFSQIILLKALLLWMKNGDGEGYENRDPLHFAYVLGSDGKVDESYGDTPDKNRLYRMLKILSESLRGTPDIPSESMVYSWEDFCKLTIGYYQKHKELINLIDIITERNEFDYELEKNWKRKQDIVKAYQLSKIIGSKDITEKIGLLLKIIGGEDGESFSVNPNNSEQFYSVADSLKEIMKKSTPRYMT